LNAGSADADAYNNMVIVLEDSATAVQKSVRTIVDYAVSTRTVTIDSAPDFTIANTDKFSILAVAPGSTPPTVGQIRAEMDSNSTQLAAILEDTGTTLDALIKDVPTVAEFNARTLVAADYTVVSDLGTIQTADHTASIAAIGAKTTNLPSDPADQSAVEAAIPTADEIALAILKKDWTGINGEAARSLLNAVRFLRNKWSVAGGTLTVTKEDDSTPAWTATVTGDASADPITGSTPL
jgi:hypothetical protein